ncbi:hypothetical protein BS50DRAFT_243523 [Corynespora cassiicola Philippines]|uniref:Uncharacterized protein n=1 Tax=Corynespora cassiicola Philippines TaxID=1448308 RepID=A0A2T2P3M6_CORCC|nr:hypothetical protein BS50DRAFT_243523 [Corynespora cassiicola Philippines]
MPNASLRNACFCLFTYTATFIVLVRFLERIGICDKLAGLFMTLTILSDAFINQSRFGLNTLSPTRSRGARFSLLALS